MENNEEDKINRDYNVNWNEDISGINEYESLRDKWGSIQDEYLDRYPELDLDDLYFESGGMEGLLEKISEVGGKSIDEIRREIMQW